VKDSFRRLVLLIHPDKTSHLGAQEAFHLVQEAYESLSSPIERLAYDQYLVKLRAKRWKQRLRPLVDKVDDFSDYYEPILERKGQIAAAAFLLWALVL
jgi:curved DNA-binding protein CbpA